MNILKKIKGLLLNKYAYGLLALLSILLLILILRGCSTVHIGSKTVFKIARESNWHIELLGRERGLIGFTNDLLATIASENKMRFQWIETNPSYLVNGLDNGTYDFILTIMRPNVVNQERYDFSELIFDLGPVLIVREESQISSLKEMHGKPIGIAYGLTTNFNSIRTPGINVYDMSLIYYNSMNRALEDLSHDMIDGVIMQAIPAYAATQGLYAGKLKVVTAPFNDEGLRIVSLKSSSLSDVINVINETINKMREDGTYKTLIDKWNLIDPQSQYRHAS